MLASKTPIWRSQFIVACIALGFIGLVVRAAYVQVVGNAFFRKQGIVRFERQLDIPANRGRILDRNGLILASSVPMPSIWACPEEMEADDSQLKALGQLLDMPLTELQTKVGDTRRKHVWLRRQLDDATGKKIKELAIHGIYTTMEYKRMYPQGEAAAQVGGGAVAIEGQAHPHQVEVEARAAQGAGRIGQVAAAHRQPLVLYFL